MNKEYHTRLEEIEDRMKDFKEENSNHEARSEEIIEQFREPNEESKTVSDNINDVNRPKQQDKKRDTLKRRVDELAYNAKMAATREKQLLAEIQERDRILMEQAAQISQNKQHANAYYEESLEFKEQAVLERLKIAKENGDFEKEIACTQELANVASRKATQQLSRSLNQQHSSAQAAQHNYQQYNNYAEPQYTPSYEPEPVNEPVNEHYENWLDDNPWADSNSPEYDQSMAKEVYEISQAVDKQFILNRQRDMIGTPQYFDKLNNIMSYRYGVGGNNQSDEDNNFPDNRNYPEQTRPTRQQEHSVVAPVSRGSGGMAAEYSANNRGYSPLSDQEMRMAAEIPRLHPTENRYATQEERLAMLHQSKQAVSKFTNHRR